MPVVGDVIQIKDVQAFAGVEGEIMNVYYYKVLALGAPFSLPLSAEVFAESWALNFTSQIIQVQASQVTHVRLEVNNLMNYDTDFFVHTYLDPINGSTIADYGSPTTALSYQLVRTNRTTRNGSKRIGGIPSDWILDNSVIAAHVDEVALVQNALGAELDIEYSVIDSVTLQPVILKSPVLTTVPPTIINPVSSAAFRGVGTQNTRKQLLG